jgi:hypothetical protein
MPPSPDPLANPYAPPAAEAPPEASTVRGARSDYDGERRSVLLMVLLSVVTFGFYPVVWYIRRTPFLNARWADKGVGILPWAVAMLYAALFLAGLARAPENFVRSIQLVAGITNLVLAFRVAAILRSDFSRTGRFVGVSSVAVFFFGCLYLQHVINKAADTPMLTRKKRKKKKAASREPAPQTEAAPADAGEKDVEEAEEGPPRVA